MLSTKEFEDIKKDLEKFEEAREATIQKSRNIILLSKQIIHALHRDKLEESEPIIVQIKNEVKELSNTAYNTTIHKIAIQEYVEALTFYEFVKNKKIPTRKELGVETETYLLGLCDLTGELVRKAVNDIINQKFEDALKIKDVVAELYGEFLKLHFRVELRKKFDSIKWNLNKLEDLEMQI